MLKRGIPALVLAALLVGAMPVQAQQTARQQRPAAQQQMQMQRLQQQMMDMQRHMQQLRERIHVVDEELTRTMDRIRDQDRDQDRDRLREHRALREMATDLGEMARQMEQNAYRLREAAQNRVFQQDDQLQREAERLRERYRNMEQEMVSAVEALERMQKRLGQITEQDSP